MDFLRLFLRRHFAGKPVLGSRNVGCFLRLVFHAADFSLSREIKLLRGRLHPEMACVLESVKYGSFNPGKTSFKHLMNVPAWN